MTNDTATPPEFDSVVNAVAEVARELGSSGFFRPVGNDQWLHELTISWGDGIEHVSFVLEARLRLLVTYVVLDLEPGSTSRAAVLEAIARANFGLLPGCFELDVDGGQLRHRSAIGPVGERTGNAQVARLLASALGTCRDYAPAFRRVAEGGVAPKVAIEDVGPEDSPGSA